MNNLLIFSYFSTETYVVGTQKNRLIGTVLLCTQNMFQRIGKTKNSNFTLNSFAKLSLINEYSDPTSTWLLWFNAFQ